MGYSSHGPAHGERSSPEALAERVHGRSEQVAGGILHGTHPAPPFPHRQEGVLHDFLGLMPTPRHEVQRAKQPCAFGFDELLERWGRWLRLPGDIMRLVPTEGNLHDGHESTNRPERISLDRPWPGLLPG